jgi:hypothetical protein
MILSQRIYDFICDCSTAAMTGLLLPMRFDRELLQADILRVQTEEWLPHYNQMDYAGSWSGAALRSPIGAQNPLFAGQAESASFTDTNLLSRCDGFRSVLSSFKCPLKSVRLLRLAPGSIIREHCDPSLSYDDGEVRIHIPIQTSPDVEFTVGGERLLLEEGECYYINTTLPHSSEECRRNGPDPSRDRCRSRRLVARCFRQGPSHSDAGSRSTELRGVSETHSE